MKPKIGQIHSECYGGGHRWYCTKCDADNRVIRWTNSTPPKKCDRCGSREAPVGLAMKADMVLRDTYGDRYVTPGSTAVIAELIVNHGLADGCNPHRLAAIINQGWRW